MPAHNGSVYIEHTFEQPGKFVGLVTWWAESRSMYRESPSQ
jgi:hypothetical protein